MLVGLFLTLLIWLGIATPYVPSSGWTYFVEAVRAKPWPACSYRFLSYEGSCSPEVNLWNGTGVNQGINFVKDLVICRMDVGICI